MIKLVFCVRRQPTLSREEFQQYWLEKHAPLVREHAEVLGARRYVQSHTFADARLAPVIGPRKSAQEAYDGIAELWYDSVEDIAGRTSQEVIDAARLLLKDERNFIDLPNSLIFFTREHEIVG